MFWAHNLDLEVYEILRLKVPTNASFLFQRFLKRFSSVSHSNEVIHQCRNVMRFASLNY